MRATGIVRRMDDLGRVVLPKEIRRTMRIKEGSPLEIFTENDGYIILKKYSPIGELAPFASQCADILGRFSGLAAIVTDRERIVAVSGLPKRETLDMRLSKACDRLMEERKNYRADEASAECVRPVEGLERLLAVFAPIVAAGDVAGSVMLLEEGARRRNLVSETALTGACAAFLAKQLED